MKKVLIVTNRGNTIFETDILYERKCLDSKRDLPIEDYFPTSPKFNGIRYNCTYI